jgi:hypothetical protein
MQRPSRNRSQLNFSVALNLEMELKMAVLQQKDEELMNKLD